MGALPELSTVDLARVVAVVRQVSATPMPSKQRHARHRTATHFARAALMTLFAALAIFPHSAPGRAWILSLAIHPPAKEFQVSLEEITAAFLKP